MAEKFVSIREAADSLKISERTLYRKIDRGEIESRLTDNGHREVKIDVPLTSGELSEEHLKAAKDTVDNQQKLTAIAIATTNQLSEQIKTELTFVKSELARAQEKAQADLAGIRQQTDAELNRLMEMADRHLDSVRTEAARSRRLSLAGWSLTAAMVVVLVIVSLSMGRKLAMKEAEVKIESARAQHAGLVSDMLKDQVADQQKQLQRIQAELDATRLKLSKMTVTPVNQPTSRPSMLEGALEYLGIRF